ncbi:(d)CMP kinase [Thalassorhabdus alkalitolerans]|uniref:Cytidylate kinase n=1 Tax=Thalassorhabdus alkalitolerans TaxID=2282697 RepID=A0ABW0YS46_9BACI
MMKLINIAIDGPAGAGKSTVAKKVASALSYLYIDTGAMYRAITWKALQEKADLNNGEQLGQLLESTKIRLVPDEKGTEVFVDDEEVSAAIRQNEVTRNVSIVAAHEKVREQMVEAQRELASRKGAVLDGRDIGTAVLPDAEVKVFLTASVEERAKRRYEEEIQKGMDSKLDAVIEEIRRRDQLDSTRLISPLTKAEDAEEIDTTQLSIEKVVQQICRLVEERVRAT